MGPGCGPGGVWGLTPTPNPAPPYPAPKRGERGTKRDGKLPGLIALDFAFAFGRRHGRPPLVHPRHRRLQDQRARRAQRIDPAVAQCKLDGGCIDGAGDGGVRVARDGQRAVVHDLEAEAGGGLGVRKARGFEDRIALALAQDQPKVDRRTAGSAERHGQLPRLKLRADSVLHGRRRRGRNRGKRRVRRGRGQGRSCTARKVDGRGDAPFLEPLSAGRGIRGIFYFSVIIARYFEGVMPVSFLNAFARCPL